MKLMKAYIRLDTFEIVRQALKKEGYTNMTVMEAEGMRSYSNLKNRHGSLKFPALHSKVVKLEMVSEADHVDAIVNITWENASTGHEGDGLMQKMMKNPQMHQRMMRMMNRNPGCRKSPRNKK